MRALLKPFLPACWLVAYWYFCWAGRDMHPSHPDAWEVLQRRRHYADRLRIRDVPVNRPVPSWFPRHWNCRCAYPRPQARPLPRRR